MDELVGQYPDLEIDVLGADDLWQTLAETDLAFTATSRAKRSGSAIQVQDTEGPRFEAHLNTVEQIGTLEIEVNVSTAGNQMISTW